MNSIKIAAGLLLIAPGLTLANPIVYDWSTANASAAGVLLDHKSIVGDNNDNWENLAGFGDGADDSVVNVSQPPLFAGNYYVSSGTGPGGGFGMSSRRRVIRSPDGFRSC